MWFLTGFFLRNAFHSRKAVWIAVLGFSSIGISIAFLAVSSLLPGEGMDGRELFHQISFSLFLHILLPLISALAGAGIVAEEVEERTLPYLLTRPVAKWKLVLAKSLSALTISASVILFSLALTFVTIRLFGGSLGRMPGVGVALKTGGALLLGLFAYIPLFALLGATLRKPVLTGLLFTFGWENMVVYIPSKIRLLTIMHYLHNVFPDMTRFRSGGEASFLFNLLISDEGLSVVTSQAILLLLSAVLLGATIATLYLKEYRLDAD